MNAPIRLGVLGLGAVAQAVHLPLLAKRPDLYSIAAVADFSPDVALTIGTRFGVNPRCHFNSLEAMLHASDLDAVMLLHRGSHAKATLEVYASGLPVFVEKPLAFTTAEVDELLNAEPALGHPTTMLGYMKQYDPAVLEAARLLTEIDDIRSIETTVLHPTGASQLTFARIIDPQIPLTDATVAEIDSEDARLWVNAVGGASIDVWRTYRGALVSSLAHDLSILRSLDSMPVTIEFADIWRQSSKYAVRDVGRDRKSFGDHPPSISARGNLASGGRYSLSWHYLPDFPAYREIVKIVHGRGEIELIFPSPYLMHAPTELRVSSLDGDTEDRVLRRNITEAFETQLESFHAMIRNGTQPKSGLVEGRTDILICQQILGIWANRTGETVGGEVGELIKQGL